MSTVRHDDAARLHAERGTVEDLVAYIADLVLERQRMRATGAPRDVLEQNRALLVAAHWDLSRALIERHCASGADAAPAAA